MSLRILAPCLEEQICRRPNHKFVPQLYRRVPSHYEWRRLRIGVWRSTLGQFRLPPSASAVRSPDFPLKSHTSPPINRWATIIYHSSVAAHRASRPFFTIHDLPFTI